MSQKQERASVQLQQALAEIAAESRGRLGVAVLDTNSGLEAGYQSDQRFAMCSTFKLLLAAQVMQKVQLGDLRLERRLHFARSSVLEHSPVSGPRAGDGGGMTLLELCEAAIVVSDNTAANVLLEQVDGPRGLTEWLRANGDTITRLDRYEPELNSATPGDERDTTTPLAMLQNLQSMVLGSKLDGLARAMLQQWMLDSRTGDQRLRAGMPTSWKVGGKTGSGTGTANDVVLAWPMPQTAPVLVSCYLTQSPLDDAARNACLAKVGKAVSRWYFDI